ncbi:MAG: copper resistance protein B [Sphingomonadaceae bacterium]|nr:copper resistance protein B [Sphingomonadaceae bacterium]
MIHRLAVFIVIACAAPGAAQPATAAAGSVDPQCPPEHAAMGHCTPAAPTSPPAPADPACPPEHAAMGHCTPRTAPPPIVPPPPAVATDPACPPEHAAMGHCTPSSTPPTAGASPAPSRAGPSGAALGGPEHAADAVWGADVMAPVRRAVYAEHGAFRGGKLLIDRLEYRAQDGHDGYAWEGEAWYGGDYDRLWVKSEGEGGFGEALESAEIQALWSRALDPWFNLQTGIRYDLRPRPDRAHLAVGIQGLAPYWFEVDVAAFLSDRGDLTARAEAEYDQRITNRLIVQPRAEIELSAQDVPAIGLGAGLSSIEAGIRLRYELVPEFAPYVGVDYERSFGATADFARAAGEGVGGWAFVAGIRAWF